MFIIIVNALHVSGGPSAHHQELIKLYVQHWVLSCFPAGKHDNTYGCTYSFISSWWWAEGPPETCRAL